MIATALRTATSRLIADEPRPDSELAPSVKRSLIFHRRIDAHRVERILCYRPDNLGISVTYNFPDGAREEYIHIRHFDRKATEWIAAGFSIRP